MLHGILTATFIHSILFLHRMIKDESHNHRDILIMIWGNITEDYVPKVSNLNACVKVR